MWSDNKAHIDATNSYYCDYFDYYFSSCSVGIGNKNKLGYDIDARGGYDFGMFRLEGELAYKHAKQKARNFGNSFGGNIGVDGHTSNFSAMLNGLVDFGGNDGINFSLGGGIGWSKTKYSLNVNTVTAGSGDYYFDHFGGSLSKSKLAWQLLAEMRYPISPQVDIGLRYRYFNAGSLDRTFDDGSGGLRSREREVPQQQPDGELNL